MATKKVPLHYVFSFRYFFDFVFSGVYHFMFCFFFFSLLDRINVKKVRDTILSKVEDLCHELRHTITSITAAISCSLLLEDEALSGKPWQWWNLAQDDFMGYGFIAVGVGELQRVAVLLTQGLSKWVGRA